MAEYLNSLSVVGSMGEWHPSSLSKPIIHVEVKQSNRSALPAKNVEFLAYSFLQKKSTLFENPTVTEFEDAELQQHIESISLCDDSVHYMQTNGKGFSVIPEQLVLHVYRIVDEGPSTEELNDEELPAANHWMLPSIEFEGLWESLIYDTDIKSQLLNFVSTTLLFSDKKVNSNIISWNRVVLLHGPPGSGKTSLCRALAHKLSIRLSHRYIYGQLVEINSHSLFSKWFSESGKLVMKMFQKIQEFIDEPEALVFVLIDEVESLAHARKSCMGGNDPSDAIRVVNALLTQLDAIKRYPNVIILTTSNVTEAIDLALIDRADIKQYVGLPSFPAIYHIYQSCIAELQKVGIITSQETILPLRQLNLTTELGDNLFIRYSSRLKEIAKESEGLSGRTLRRLPFLAHTFYIQCDASDQGLGAILLQTTYDQPSPEPVAFSSTMTLDAFLSALSKVVKKEFKDRSELKNSFAML